MLCQFCDGVLWVSAKRGMYTVDGMILSQKETTQEKIIELKYKVTADYFTVCCFVK